MPPFMSGTVGDDVADRMTAVQRAVVDGGARVLVLFEGRTGRVLGRVVNEFMNLLEPRGVLYTHFEPGVDKDPRTMLHYMSREPAVGSIAIYDRSWYSSLVERASSGDGLDTVLETTLSFERYLYDNGIILVKFLLQAGDDNIDKLGKVYGYGRSKSETFLTDDHIDLGKYGSEGIREVLSVTDTDFAPWDVVEIGDVEDTVTEICDRFVRAVRTRMDAPRIMSKDVLDPIYHNPRVSADLTLKAKGYKERLEELSEELGILQQKLAASDRALVLVFEGRDAAGKGGSIRRVTRALNPRGYRAVPVAAPVGDERVHTYLWRFARSMPKRGNTVIFDRSWYGRMMVEPIEGFCTQEEYNRSASEINGFERSIVESGGIVIKFWMEISKDEQLRRFEARRDNPLKRWKITDEDWRNRDKWDAYETHVDTMLSTTNTPWAPWVVVESEDKKYGRIKVLETIVSTLRRELD